MQKQRKKMELTPLPRMLEINRLDVVGVREKDSDITDEIMLIVKEIQGFLRLQERLVTEDGYRLVNRKVAKRFCRRFTARIVPRESHDMNMLILDFDHPDIGTGTQLIAFVAEG